MADLYSLKKRLEEEKRKELEQQTAPVSFATGERNDSPLIELRAKIAGTQTKVPISKSIPYTVDRDDYDQYANLVKAYTGVLADKTETLLPSKVSDLRNIMTNQGREIGRIGTGSMMYAGGNKLDQTPIEQATTAKLKAENKAGEEITRVKKYQTDLDYLLAEKTGNLTDFTARMAEASGNPEDVKKVVDWGVRMTNDMTKVAQAAAETATDAQLQDLLKNARTPAEKQVFQAEIDRRGTPAGKDRTGIGPGEHRPVQPETVSQ